MAQPFFDPTRYKQRQLTGGGGGGYEMRRTGEHELALGDRLPQPKRGGDNAGIAFFGIFKMSSTWRTQEELPGLELT